MTKTELIAKLQEMSERLDDLDGLVKDLQDTSK